MRLMVNDDAKYLRQYKHKPATDDTPVTLAAVL